MRAGSRAHLLRSPLRRLDCRLTDLSKLNSALADRLTEVRTIRVGDEVDIHLGELWHRTIRLMGVNEAHGSSTSTAPIRAEPDSLERR